MLICLAGLAAIAPVAIGQPNMNSYLVENNRIVREIAVDNQRLSTRSVGRPGAAVKTSGGDEFAVILGPSKRRLIATDFCVISVEPTGTRSLTVKLRNTETGLETQVKYCTNSSDFYMRKSLVVRNVGKQPVQILDVEVESLGLPSAKAKGQGLPVFSADLFLGIEFPLGKNEVDNGVVTLRHHPGGTLQPGESLTTKTAVIGVAAKGEKVEDAFDRYVRKIALRKPEVMTVYGNWAVYDYLSDNIRPDERMVLRTTKELADLRKLGWQPDYYVMDAGWFDTKGDYTDYVKPAWPDGPKHMVKAINDVGIDYGLWFDVGGGIEKNPAMEPSKYSSGRLCLASEPYISTFKNALIRQIEDNGLRMVKFDFATFQCDSDKHGHLRDEYAEEATLTSFLDMLDYVRKKRPNVKYIIFNGFHRSPWWLQHVDTIYTNDPAPSDTPSVRLRDSINMRTDIGVHAHRFEFLLPWYCIDDCGLMIGKTGTIYWIGAEEWRKTWIMNIGRGGMMPFIYGDLSLLDDSDRRFLVKTWSLVRDNPKVFADTQAIGSPNGEEVYGYSHFAERHGFIFLNNPTFEVKTKTIKLDASIGLKARGKSPLGVTELFPAERAYTAALKSGEELTLELAPFEVLALEVKPANGQPPTANRQRSATSGSATLPITLTPRDSAWLTDSTLTMLNAELQYLAKLTGRETETIDQSKLQNATVYSCEIQLPEFSEPRTLALPVRFTQDGHPRKFGKPTNHALAAAWSGSGQLFLETTPEYGRPIWSQCSWVTFHARLDASFSGKKVQVILVGMELERALVKFDKAYMLEK